MSEFFRKMVMSLLQSTGVASESAKPLPPRSTSATGTPDREQLEALLARYQSSVAKVASHFGKDRRQVYRWLKKWDLSADDFR